MTPTPKRGRPLGAPNKTKRPDTKGRIIHLRMSNAEADELAECAGNVGETPSEFARTAIIRRCRQHEQA